MQSTCPEEGPLRWRSIEKIVNAFLASRPGLKNAAWAGIQCQIASRALHEQLVAAGVQASVVWVRGHRVHPTKASPRALAASRHMVIGLPSGAFVDVSRRQFEPSGGHPRYYASEADLAGDWREIDDGPPDGRLEDERWRALGLAPWEPGASGKGVVLASGSIHTWGVDASGVPRHTGGLRVLEEAPEDVACYFIVDPDCSLKLLSGDSEFAAIISAADPRLAATDPADWSFDA